MRLLPGGKVRRGRPGGHHPHPQALLWAPLWLLGFAQDSTHFPANGKRSTQGPLGNVGQNVPCRTLARPGSSVLFRFLLAWHPAVQMLLGNENLKSQKPIFFNYSLTCRGLPLLSTKSKASNPSVEWLGGTICVALLRQHEHRQMAPADLRVHETAVMEAKSH